LKSQDTSNKQVLAFYTHLEPVDPKLADALAPFELRHFPIPVGGASGMIPEINLLLSTAHLVGPVAVALFTKDLWETIKHALRSAWNAKSQPPSDDHHRSSGSALIRLSIQLEGIGDVRFDVCPENNEQFNNAMNELLPLIQQISSSGVGYWARDDWRFDGPSEPEP